MDQRSVYNRYLRENITLDETDVICSLCSGTGFNSYRIGAGGYQEKYFIPRMCSGCNGRGKLDWVEQIVGVKNNDDLIKKYMEKAAEELAKQIDAEIMKQIMSP